MRSDDESAERELLERIDNDLPGVIQVYTDRLDEVGHGPIYVEQLMLSALAFLLIRLMESSIETHGEEARARCVPIDMRLRLGVALELDD